MTNKKSVTYRLVVIMIASLFTALTIVGSCQGNDSVKEPKKKDPPIIIWFHNGVCDSPKALKVALSSGLVTHVMIKYMHRADADWKTNPKVRQAIDIAKNSNAELIWSRNLWTYYNNEGVTENDIFDPNYYIHEIQQLRSEAKVMGARYTALDLEAYGHTPVKKYLREKDKLSLQQRKKLHRTIQQVLEKIPVVDYVYPGGFYRPRNPVNILSSLGELCISEDTYYDSKERLAKIKYEYHIFGAYLGISKKNFRNAKLPLYLVSEIFTKSERWSAKKGLFLYPREKKALEIAQELLAYSKSLPLKKDLD